MMQSSFAAADSGVYAGNGTGNIVVLRGQPRRSGRQEFHWPPGPAGNRTGRI
jgi:hypothetical protein